MIVEAYTVSNPWAVMIIPQNAYFAYRTVMSSSWSILLASVAIGYFGCGVI
jgi:hypothetical protein